MATAITATKVSWPNCLPSHKIILWQQQQLVLAAAADKLQVVPHVAHTRAGKTRATREKGKEGERGGTVLKKFALFIRRIKRDESESEKLCVRRLWQIKFQFKQFVSSSQ